MERRRARNRLVHGAVLVWGLAVVAGCTPDDGRTAGATTTTTTEATTTTTIPPLVLALSPNLDLIVDECFAEIPAPTTTTTPEEEAPPGEGDGDVEPAQPTIPDTLPETTVIPRPPTIAIVDCAGTNVGQVYATFCLGADDERSGELTTVECPGDDDLEYPGDRTLRRAAARICLQRFEEQFRERYASTSRVAQEFLPTEGVWNRGDRRVVCHAHLPPAPTTTTTTTSEPQS
jgi:hypothetical protein